MINHVKIKIMPRRNVRKRTSGEILTQSLPAIESRLSGKTLNAERLTPNAFLKGRKQMARISPNSLRNPLNDKLRLALGFKRSAQKKAFCVRRYKTGFSKTPASNKRLTVLEMVEEARRILMCRML